MIHLMQMKNAKKFKKHMRFSQIVKNEITIVLATMHRGSPFDPAPRFQYQLGRHIRWGFLFQYFWGGRRSSAQSQGNDILIRYEISLESVLNGNKEEIEIDLPSTCNDCNGTGAKDGLHRMSRVPGLAKLD